MCEEAGLDFNGIWLTNVIKYRPPDNKLEAFCLKKKDLPHDYPRALPPISRAHYLRPEFLPLLEELDREILDHRPNLIILAGGTALWAAGLSSISRERGKVFLHPRWGKCLPIYHPSAVLRQWDLRPTTIFDLRKAQVECQFPELRRPERELWIEPTIGEIGEFFALHIKAGSQIAFDIETRGGLITCISLAPNERFSLCIPFFDPTKPNGNYWSSSEEELTAWSFVRRALCSRSYTTLAQNGIYDVQYLAKASIKVPRIDDDTMLLHHALYPESLKGLGFLGSIYTNELSWKGMVKDLGRDK